MSTVLAVWLQFIACVAVIGFAGFRLARYGDVIAEKAGLTGNWVGLILLATVTSLPELVAGASAVTVADVPDIAIGNVLGANVFNLFILGIVDLLYRRSSIFAAARRGHVLSAAFCVLMLWLVGFHVLLGDRSPAPALAHVGFDSLLIVALYAVAIRSLHRFEKKERAAFDEYVEPRYAHLTLRQAGWRYAGAAVLVVAAGAALPVVGARLAHVLGWSQTFVGTLLMAFATTVPETATTLAALRIGAIDMAIGNLLGSNLFNILIVAIDDLLYLPAPILTAVSPLHAVSALSGMAMSAAAIVGWVFQPQTRVFRTVGWVSLALFALYLINAYVLFLHGA
jgi:cation:H+ antiporter